MKQLFVSYKIALALKEKGFNKECFAFYNNAESEPYIKQDFCYEMTSVIYKGDFQAPMYQQVVDWFREKHNIYIEINLYADGNVNYLLANLQDYNTNSTPNYRSITSDKNPSHSPYAFPLINNGYYKALDKAIEQALKLI